MVEQIFRHSDWQYIPPPTVAELKRHNIPPRVRRKKMTRRQRMAWKPLSPLGGVRAELCAKGRSPKEVQFNLEDAGVKLAQEDGVAFSSVEVQNISARDRNTGKPNYQKCAMEQPDMSLSATQALITRAENKLKMCDLDDIECITSNVERIEVLKEQAKTMPVYADVKCFCGEVVLRQTEQDKNVSAVKKYS